MDIASIIAAIILLALLFFTGRLLYKFILRSRGKRYFIPILIISVIGFAALLCLIPYAWLLLSILLSGENFSR